MKAVYYVRVSTAYQTKEGVLLEAKKAKIKTYCELKDLDLVEIVEDVLGSQPRASATDQGFIKS